MMVKQETIFGPFRKLHSPSSRGTESQTVRAERRIIPKSTENYRSEQGTTLDVMLERRIDDDWNVEGDRDL